MPEQHHLTPVARITVRSRAGHVVSFAFNGQPVLLKGGEHATLEGSAQELGELTRRLRELNVEVQDAG